MPITKRRAKREPAQSSTAATVFLSPRGAERWRKGHPWIYRADVRQVDPGLQGGEVVRVADARGWFLGQAFYSKKSQIALRWVTAEDARVDSEFLQARIRRADEQRQKLFPNATTYRVVHSDADLLPGLIVDRYGDYLCVQFLIKATDDRKEMIADFLIGLFGAKGLVNRSDGSVRTLEGLEPQKGTMRGTVPAEVSYREGKLTFGADLHQGQKTGAFLDQRENRLAGLEYGVGEALDCFSYNGGFALQLATVAQKVTAVEISEPAVARLLANARANGLENVEAVVGNAFDFLKAAVDEGRRYHTIVLDPPSFARRKEAVEAALRGYKEINLRALQLLHPGGILITASCSHHVPEAVFETMLGSAAADAKRRVQIIERRGAARDHPVLLNLPETRYLKCFILRAVD